MCILQSDSLIWKIKATIFFRIGLERKVYYHLIQTYVPSALFVIIAWLSLAIDPSAIPGRISMVMMTLLTLMAMFSGVRQMVPKVTFYLQQGSLFGEFLRDY